MQSRHRYIGCHGRSTLLLPGDAAGAEVVEVVPAPWSETASQPDAEALGECSALLHAPLPFAALDDVFAGLPLAFSDCLELCGPLLETPRPSAESESNAGKHAYRVPAPAFDLLAEDWGV
jgi:hypothetical protein